MAAWGKVPLVLQQRKKGFLSTKAGVTAAAAAAAGGLISCVGVDPRIRTMPGRSMSGFHRPGRHRVHQARSAVRCSAGRMNGELHLVSTKNHLWGTPPHLVHALLAMDGSFEKRRKATQSDAKRRKAMQNDAKRSEAKQDQAKPSQAKPSQAKPSHAKPSQAKPSQAEQSRAKQSKAKQSKTKQSKAKQIQSKSKNKKPNNFGSLFY